MLDVDPRNVSEHTHHLLPLHAKRCTQLTIGDRTRCVGNSPGEDPEL
jgi:hypothetical protein